jgi:hypothetical protein
LARQRLRLVQVRKPGSFDDEKTPADILANGESGEDQQEQIEYILSQIRQILGTADWKDNVPISLSDLAVVEKCNVDLLGTKNGVNVTFTTIDKFVPDTFKLYVNGIRQQVGVGCDYVISESGGSGTGYDTVTLDWAPNTGESVVGDYTVA